jgi:hypothetical protein
MSTKKDIVPHNIFHDKKNNFSFCINDSIEHISSIYQIFCTEDGKTSNDISISLKFDLEHIKTYLFGEKIEENPYEMLFSEVSLFDNLKSQFKTEYDINRQIFDDSPADNIIIQQYKNIKTLFDEAQNSNGMKSISPFGNGSITLLNIDNQTELKKIISIYTIINSKNLLKTKYLDVSTPFSLTLWELYDKLNDIILISVDKIKKMFQVKAEEKDKLYTTHLKGYSSNGLIVFFYSIEWGTPIIFKSWAENRVLGQLMNESGADAVAGGWYGASAITIIPPCFFAKALNDKKYYGNLLTIAIHEWIHDFEDAAIQTIPQFKTVRDNLKPIAEYWKDNFAKTLDVSSFLREATGDMAGIIAVEEMMGELIYSSDDDKLEMIKYSYNWTCYKFPQSTIDAAHPHHSLRMNFLLLSPKIHKFLIDYITRYPTKSFSKRVRGYKGTTGVPLIHNKGENQLCKLVTAQATVGSIFERKYLKYKAKYLKLKKLSQSM